MNFKKLTIVIVTFRSQHIIEKCLDNLDENYKKIIVENSDDVNFTKELKKKYKNLEYINIGFDSGWGYAANKGIQQSSSDYILLINPDSFPEKDCIQKIVKTAENDKDIAVVTPITLRKNKIEEFKEYGYFNSNKKMTKEFNNLLQVDWVNGNVFLVKKICFKRT